MIPTATVPFESKLVMLFVGALIGAYLVWARELTAFKDNRLLLGFLIFVVMGLALYGVVVHFRCPMKVLWTERYHLYGGRLAATYICPNHFAHLMQMLMPFCLALLFIPQTGLFLRLLAGYSFLVFLPPLFLSESRAGWLGAIAAVGITVCLMALRKSKKLFLFLVLLVPLCSTLLLFAGWRFSETFQRRAQPVVQFLQGQAEGGVGSEAKDFRPQTWMDTIDMIKEAPLVGFGPGNYRFTFPEHRKRFRGTRIVTGHPHNEYLELMADYGLIGFVLFALAWCYGLIRILKASLNAEETRHAVIGFAFLGTAAGTMVHSFFDFEMHVYPNALVFAFLAAIAVGPLFATRRAKAVKKERISHSANGANRGQRAEGPSARLRAGGESFGQTQGKQLSDSFNREGTQRAQTATSQLQSDFSHRDSGDHGEDKLSAVSSELSTQSPTTIIHQLAINMRRTGSWLLAIGYLLMTLFCLQTMSSAFIRALGDKEAQALGGGHAQRFYEIATRIDSQNWRAYKGMANLIFKERYYSLDIDEKVQLADEECRWYEMALIHNPKDPAICSGLGKSLIFLGRQAISPQPLALSSQMPAYAPEGGQAADASNFNLQTSTQFTSRGLELLREACTYRPFNDVYWWTLGVELRKLGRYEEALEVFRKALSIRNTATTRANIKWIEARLRSRGQKSEDRGQRAASGPEGPTPRREVEDSVPDSWSIPNSDDAEAEPDLMKLFEKMGE